VRRPNRLLDINDPFDRDVEVIRDAVDACRQAMIDLPLVHKTVVLNELQRWVGADCCDAIPGFVMPSTVLFASWKAWAERAGQTVGNSSQFREEMERLGVVHKHGRNGNYYRGLSIRQTHRTAGRANGEGW
jgi:hypothetical protein